MTERVNQYYQLPVSKPLLKHMREEIGLHGKYLEVFDELRDNLTDTANHADNVQLPLKTYNAMSGIVGQRCIWELIRLAEIGLKTEQMSVES